MNSETRVIFTKWPGNKEQKLPALPDEPAVPSEVPTAQSEDTSAPSDDPVPQPDDQSQRKSDPQPGGKALQTTYKVSPSAAAADPAATTAVPASQPSAEGEGEGEGEDSGKEGDKDKSQGSGSTVAVGVAKQGATPPREQSVRQAWGEGASSPGPPPEKPAPATPTAGTPGELAVEDVELSDPQQGAEGLISDPTEYPPQVRH